MTLLIWQAYKDFINNKHIFLWHCW